MARTRSITSLAAATCDGTIALRRCFRALGIVSVCVALVIAAASMAASWVMAAVIGACCAVAAGALVILELVPALAVLRSGATSAVQRHAIRRLRRQLDALPEAAHPLDASGVRRGCWGEDREFLEGEHRRRDHRGGRIGDRRRGPVK